MNDITKIHEEVYNLLLEYREFNPTLFYTFRKSNRDSRLEKGYWFYGNEWYLAISFWTGMDWKNKTPNIIFVILPETGETYLEINTSDSDEKRRFVINHIIKQIGFEIIGQRYRKYYHFKDYKHALKEFLAKDKVDIDKIIKEHAKDFFISGKSEIGFINEDDFNDQKEKIEKYRSSFNKEIKTVTIKTSQKPKKIKKIEIENYGPIKNKIEINIPFSSQWVFLTGENGTGKTSILRALTTSICNRRISIEELSSNGDFQVNLSLYVSRDDTISFNRIKNEGVEDEKVLMASFAGYGQSRLKTNHSGLSSDVLKTISKNKVYSSLFNDDSYLIDLQSQFNIWNKDSIQKEYFEKRKNYIKEILIDILPNLYNIDFEDMIGDIPATSYIEKDSDDGKFNKVTFDKLASGLKSMIAMIGDILVRLYEQQPTIYDPAEFTGIVLIDEIDIHLHPKLQKKLVEELTRTFPNLQFIVTTHSPIPFLGAPKNSQIYRVTRNAKEGVDVKELNNQLELGDLLPNTILTSPIFGLDDIIPKSHDSKHLIRTEVNYRDIEFNDLVRRKIEEFVTDEKEQQLINLGNYI